MASGTSEPEPGEEGTQGGGQQPGFPATLGEALGFLKSRYGLSEAKATSALYSLLEAELIEEERSNLPFLASPAVANVPLNEIDAHVRALFPVSNGAVQAGAQAESASVTPGEVAAQDYLQRPLPTPAALPGWQLVVTVPAGLVLPSSARVTRLRNAFANVIDAAQSDLRISSPYIEPYGVGTIQSCLEDAAERGVSAKLLVRVEDWSRPDYRTMAAVATLYDIFGGNLQVRSFYRSLQQASGGYASAFGGVHAKIIVADSKVIYVGSGEIRGNALNRNFELGFVTLDAEVAELVATLFDRVWDLSKPVSSELSHTVIR